MLPASPDPTARAVAAVQATRFQRLDAIAAAQEARETAAEITLAYAGYRDGQHWGQRLDGGETPISAASNGSIEVGELITGVIQPSGEVLAYWMPR